MAEEVAYSSVGGESNKRKYEDSPSPVTRRATGFSSAPDASGPPASYNNVPPPMNEIELAKQKAQEIAARLLNTADPSKRARGENGGSGGGGFDSTDYGSQKPYGLSVGGPPQAASYGYPGPTKKIEIPNGRVGVIIGKGGETIKYLQLQSGAKIQVTRDMDADPNSTTRGVELTGTPDQIAKAEQLINDVLSEAEAGGSGVASRRMTGQQSGADQFSMQVPNNKVGLVIGKGGETIKNMQARTGARIQVIPLHLPPGDMSKERTVQIDGTSEQIEAAKQLVEEVISEVCSMVACTCSFMLSDGFSSLCWIYFNFFLHTSSMILVSVAVSVLMLALSGIFIVWGKILDFFHRISLEVIQDLLWGKKKAYALSGWSDYIDTESLSVENRMRNSGMSGGYPQQGYQSRPPTQWAQPNPPMPQPGYGYAPPQYNMNQPPYSGYPPQPTSGGYATSWDPSSQNQQTGGYDYYNQQQQQPPQQQQTQGGSVAPAPTPAPTDGSGYNYSQSQAYSQGQGYSQEGYGGYQAQPNPSSGYDQQQQGYNSNYGNVSNPTPDTNTTSYGEPNQAQSYNTNYAPQAAASQPGYGSYGPPQAQKPQNGQPAYAQPQQSPSAQGGGYAYSQAGYAQTSQAGYGAPPYGAPPPAQPSYGQQQASAYNSAYGGGYSQPQAYSSEATPPPQAAQPSGAAAAKASPPS
ncbi:hypothetical protein BUALT_Bualt05G0013300 [Buddleja alternifolia]|uniref:K Homology domain-containing protein n=1 Tax=Buddleja alternifolia TaxID=168488 RepID=A0AAV6XP68_9LAMI|nr:hypothetical protein BUALT_Bualt05G0013300 [Buddleja alternifolia]